MTDRIHHSVSVRPFHLFFILFKYIFYNVIQYSLYLFFILNCTRIVLLSDITKSEFPLELIQEIVYLNCSHESHCSICVSIPLSAVSCLQKIPKVHYYSILYVFSLIEQSSIRISAVSFYFTNHSNE